MTPEQIEQVGKQADAYAAKLVKVTDFASMDEFARIRDTHFARLVEADALERAAVKVAQMPFDSTPRQCAEAIEALAAAEKEQPK